MLFSRHGIEVLDVRLFPVSQIQVGAPPEGLWAERRARVERALTQAPDGEVRVFGEQLIQQLERYSDEAKKAGPSFVEIQITMLFATVGQRSE